MLTRSKLFHPASPRNQRSREAQKAGWGMELQKARRILKVCEQTLLAPPRPLSVGTPLPSSISIDGGWFFGEIEVRSLQAWGHQAQWRMGVKQGCKQRDLYPKAVEPQPPSTCLLPEHQSQEHMRQKKILLWGNWKAPDRALRKMTCGSPPTKEQALSP